jgi:hypothetical protein
MRVFTRVLYAIFVVGVFLWVYKYSIDRIEEKYWRESFGASLVDENSELPEFYYFYTSIPDYHKTDPLVNIDVDGYQIRGYEVATTEILEDQTIEVKDYLYFIVYSPNQDLSVVKNIMLTDGETELNISLVQFKLLNILNGVNEEGAVYLEKNLFFESAFTTIKLTGTYGEVITESNFTIEETQFTIKEELESFYQEHNKFPSEEDVNLLNEEKIGIQTIHDDVELDGSILLLNMSLYFLGLVIFTFVIFFRKKKYD